MAVTLEVGGELINCTAAAAAPALGNVSINWGVEQEGAQSGPSTMTFTVLVRNSIEDAPWLVDGAPVRLMEGSTVVFTGRIRRQESTPDAYERQHVLVTCADYLSDLEDVFVSADLPPATSPERAFRLVNLFDDNGFQLEEVATFPSWQTRAWTSTASTKLKTLLERFLNSDKLTYFDATVDAMPARRGNIKLRPPRATSFSVPPRLSVTSAGEWVARINRAAIGFYNLYSVHARDALLDVSWRMDTSGLVTAIGHSYPFKEQYARFSEMTDDREYLAESASIQTYGLRRVQVDTDLQPDSTRWDDTVSRLKSAWLQLVPEWLPTAITFRGSSSLTPAWQQMLSVTSRNSLWVEVYGLHANQPKRGFNALNAPAIGGQLKYDGKQWTITVALGRSISPAVAGAVREWTLADVAASTNPAIRDATIASVGNSLTPNDFIYIAKD